MELVTPPRRFDVHLVDLDPTRGSEIQKTRPCVIVSPDESNRHLRTVVIAPLTSTIRDYPSRLTITFQRRRGQIVVDQLRTIDKTRLVKPLGRLPDSTARDLADLLVRFFAYE